MHLINRPAPCRTYVLAVVLELDQNLLVLVVLNVGLVLSQYSAIVGTMDGRVLWILQMGHLQVYPPRTDGEGCESRTGHARS